MDIRFINNTMDVLVSHGWSDARKVSTIKITNLLENNGFRVFKNAISFLESFEGLHLIFNQPRSSEKDDINLNLEYVVNDLYSEKVYECYEPIIKENLTPIGTCSNNYMFLLIGESGKIYAAVDNYVIKLGNDSITALSTLINGLDFEILSQ